MNKALPRLIAVIAFFTTVLSVGCGKKSDPKLKDDAPVKPPVAPLALPTLGVDRVGRFNFIFGDGQGTYDKAVAAYKAKAGRDWNGVRANCEATLAKDPQHLDAHRLLATALVHAGENAAAVDHLVTAIAGDYFKYAPSLASDDDLKAFLATSHGQAVGAAADQIKIEYARRIKDALWLVGRRSTFKWPKELGVQAAISRGELYAYDREAKRFFRLTHTEHQVAGFVRSPSGGEVALIGFDKIDRPKDDGAPLFAHAWIQAVDTTDWKPGPRTTIANARQISVGYGAGDELLVATAPATGRWTIGPETVSSIDRATGKLTKVTASPPVPRVVLTLDEGHLVRAPEGTEAAWSGDPPTTTSFKTAAGGTVQVPETGQAAQASLAVAPGSARVGFATAVDPCAKDAAPSLYVADAKTGTFKHVLTAKSRFATRWLDGNVIAYEDGDGAIRLWDASTGREAMRLDDKAGLALDVLSLASAPLCKQAPPTAEPAGSDEPLPPEDPSGGPVTTP
ncbi:MAG: hypothetical protein JWO36_3107 [Myxococcales bacterium]|nr:hypothetical protein [Myxococcales bacterium]